jgi:hypothetical protein
MGALPRPSALLVRPSPLVRALLGDKLHYFTSKYTKTTKIPARQGVTISSNSDWIGFGNGNGTPTL